MVNLTMDGTGYMVKTYPSSMFLNGMSMVQLTMVFYDSSAMPFNVRGLTMDRRGRLHGHTKHNHGHSPWSDHGLSMDIHGQSLITRPRLYSEIILAVKETELLYIKVIMAVKRD